MRHLQERPILEKRLVLAVQMHRLKCPSAQCPRRTFAENVGSLAGRYQRRTRSQANALHALDGEPAARLAAALGLHTSADTVLRELRRTTRRTRRPRPRVVGIDDWAISRGHNYGTIVVDLERREPIEVFVGRETDAILAWLRANPSIEIVARDRAGAYSEAADIAPPSAVQVSDRWHLLSNLRDNVERMLQRMGPQMRLAAQTVVVSEAALGRPGRAPGPHRSWSHGGPKLTAWQRLSDDRRLFRLALFEQVMALYAQGCQSPPVILRDLRQRGYIGSRAAVQHRVSRPLFPQGKPALTQPAVRALPCPSTRRAFGWMVGWKRLAVTEPK